MIKKTNLTFGGNLKSNPKTARPISTKLDMHVILKSPHASGKHSFSRHERWILTTANRIGQKFGVKIKDLVAMSNHVHIKLRVSNRKSFAFFLAALSGLIARKMMSAERGRPSFLKLDGQKFFEGRPFSRIVAAGKRSYLQLQAYFNLNRLEKRGFSKELSRSFGLENHSYLGFKESS